jgi:ribonuclease VapC
LIALDTSAIVAIVMEEPERGAFKAVIRASAKALISTVSVIETKMVIHSRRGERGVILVDDLLRLPMIEITPPGSDDLEAAYRAFVAFGKGSGHSASLNFGDVFSYALAKVRGLPLLFKGNDFIHTDILSASRA